MAEDSSSETYEILVVDSECYREDEELGVIVESEAVLRRGESYLLAQDIRVEGEADLIQIIQDVPLTHFRPPFAEGLTIAPLEIVESNEVYIKEPSLFMYGSFWTHERPTYFKQLQQEISAYERLRLHPHPNIAVFYGSVVEDGLITGLALRRYSKTLEELLEEEAVSHDQRMAYLKDVENAMTHLHSLGLVHGDIDPVNVMLDDTCNSAVLVDFDCCLPVGEPFGPKFREDNVNMTNSLLVAEFDNDYVAFRRLEEFLLETN